ncbi:hypothetical protein [Rhizobium mesoamericanum]|uniref:hypothetical protein n=1 Tax=Rhizobium mesoamericanum TaxID=1079800 RepID=UPI0004164435|nr:hypothetical protein [Rhizobium mesoamericanum]
MEPNELLTRLKYRRFLAITKMLERGETDELITQLSAIQGAIAAVEARAAEEPAPGASPWEDPNFSLKDLGA